jgi:hypothetical protein
MSSWFTRWPLYFEAFHQLNVAGPGKRRAQRLRAVRGNFRTTAASKELLGFWQLFAVNGRRVTFSGKL